MDTICIASNGPPRRVVRLETPRERSRAGPARNPSRQECQEAIMSAVTDRKSADGGNARRSFLPATRRPSSPGTATRRDVWAIVKGPVPAWHDDDLLGRRQSATSNGVATRFPRHDRAGSTEVAAAVVEISFRASKGALGAPPPQRGTLRDSAVLFLRARAGRKESD